MTDKNLIKYQTQARRLGLTNVNANNIHILLWQIVDELKARPDAGTSRFTKRKYMRLLDGMTCGTTLYDYYNGIIYDTVQVIRKGGTAYVFRIEHIADVIKHEKHAGFTYLPGSDSFAVTLEGE